MLAHYRTSLGLTTQRQLPPTPMGKRTAESFKLLAGGRIEERWLGSLSRAGDECHMCPFLKIPPSKKKLLHRLTVVDFCLGESQDL